MTNQNQNNFKLLNVTVLAEMKAEHQARKDKQFKQTAPYSEAELAFINELLDACFSDLISQRAIVQNHKQFKADGKSHAAWFVGINKDRTHTDFKRQFEKMFKERKELSEKAKAEHDAAVETAARQATAEVVTPEVVVTPPPVQSAPVEPAPNTHQTNTQGVNVALDLTGLDLTNMAVQALLVQAATNPAVIPILDQMRNLPKQA